jgi:two-component system CheB/CheR fusion protein
MVKTNSEASISESQFEKIAGRLRSLNGFNLKAYKEQTVMRRLARRISMVGCKTVEDYLAYLENTPAEATALFNDLLIEVTSFFRDPEAYASLTEAVIRDMVNKDVPEIRLWIPACASGQEAYSVAILLAEALEKAESDKSFRIFATDISEEAVAFSAAGIYHPDMLANMQKYYREKYFYPVDDNRFRIHPRLRTRISFFKHNLLSDPPFPYIDLICCRNLLIYFKPEFQQQIIATFHFSLREGGTLFLGSSEGLNSLSYGFNCLDNRWRIYEKNSGVKLPFAAHRLRPKPLQISNQSQSLNSLHNHSKSRLLDIWDSLLAIRGEPGILLDSNHEILHINGEVMKYFSMIRGRLSTHLLDWASGELKIGISSALRRSESDQSAVRISDVPVDNSVFKGMVEVIATPFKSANDQYHFLQICQNDYNKTGKTKSLEFNLEQEARQRIEELETEVKELQNSLYCAIEEKKSSQEELQASNEELRASNEELQSSNEELQAISTEHEGKIRELTSLNNDMHNLLVSTDIAVIFLDNQLRIRRYTPVAEKLLKLDKRDLGREITSIYSELINTAALKDDAIQTLRIGEMVESEIKTANERTFLYRILPYRDESSTIQGIVLTFTDTTNLRAAESAFLDSEIRFQAAVEAVNDVVWSYDVGNDHFEFSDRWIKIVGKDCRTKNMSLAEFVDYVHVDDRPLLTREFNSLFSEQLSFETDFRVFCAENSNWRWLNSRGRIIEYENNGKPCRILGTFSDISYRKELEAAQQQKQSLLSLLCDGVGLGFWIYDLNKDRIKVDQVFTAITDHGRSSFSSQAFLKVCFAKDRKAIRKLFKNVTSGKSETIICELRILRGNIPTWIRLSGIVSEHQQDGSPAIMIGFIENINQRKLAENSLKEYSEEIGRQKKNFEDLVHHMPLAVLGKRPADDYRYFLCNPAAEKLLKKTKEEVIGHDLNVLLKPEDARFFSDYDRQIVKNPKVIDIAEQKLYLGDQEREVRICKIPVLDAQKQVVSIFVLIQDMTEERSLGRQLLHSQKMDAIGCLAGGIAHDFNNMLQAIMGYGSLIGEEINEQGEARENLSLVLKAADQASSLVKQLMTFSHKQDFHKQPSDLVMRVKDIAKMLNRLLGDHIKVVTDYRVSEVWSLIDTNQIEQAMINLCLNAKDAMAGGGILQLSVDKRSLPGHEDPYALISVKDTGPGIPEEVIEHIFEPFYTTKSLGKGTGLGLATVYAIINQHQGFIKVESAPEKGSEFQIFLPVAEKKEAARPAVDLTDTQSKNGETILLAEDQEMVRNFAARILSKAGYQVIEAEDGQKAVEVFQGNCDKIDILVFDVMMPQLNGREAYEKIKETHPDIPVLFCSGYGDEVLKSEYMVEIEGTLLAKPYKSSQLLKEIKILLSG